MNGENTGLNSSTKIQLFLFTIVIALAALNFLYLWIQTSNPGETSNPESLFILHSAQLAEGKPLYTDFRKFPFNVTQYTPVYYAVLSSLKRTFLLDIQQLFVWGRRLTLAFALAIGLLIYLHGKKLTDNMLIAVIAAFIFLGSYMLWPLACTNRADMLGTLFSVAGVFTFWHVKKNGIYLAIPFFLLAFYTKQSYLSAPAAIALYLLLNRQFSRSILFSGAFGGLTVLIWFLLHTATNGLSTLNLVGANIAPMQFQNLRIVAGQFLQTAALPLILSCSGLTNEWKKDPLSVYFVVSLLLGIFSAAKLGSSLNYFLEPMAAGCFLIPIALKYAMELGRGSKTILVSIFVILAFPQINFLTHALQSLKFNRETSVMKIAGDARGLIISDNPRVSIASRNPFFVDPYVYSYLESTGKWSSSELVSMILNGKVEMLILLSPLESPLTWQGVTRLPQSIIETCRKEYTHLGLVEGYTVYVHKNIRASLRQ